MKKGLYILSILTLSLCILLSIPMLCIWLAEKISGDSAFSLILLLLGSLGFGIMMFEWEIVFPILFVLLTVIVIAFIHAIKNKMLSKSTVIALVSINTVTILLMVARAIGWFVITSSI